MRTSATCTAFLATAVAVAALASGSGPARAQGSSEPTQPSCTREQFRSVVNEAGASLRRINAENRPRLEAGLRKLREKHGWGEEEYVEKSNQLLTDARSEAYDSTASDLLVKLDRLAEEGPADKPDCSKLAELESTVLELQATVRVKTQYTITRIDALLGEPGSKTAAAEPPAAAPPLKPAVPAAPKVVEPAPDKAAKAPAPAAQTPPKPAAAPPAKGAGAPAATPASPKAPAQGWSTNTREAKDAASTPPAPPGPVASAEPAIPAPIPPGASLPPFAQDPNGFSQDEIKEASRGFFGSISAGLGNVIEHAFGQLGRPTAYVLGNEGGGAFIAGVRYGKGTLFTRGGRSREVHWHGPSIGYDFGAAGSKTLFLVYGLKDDLDIFAGFSGIDGSAYLVGGVGMTLLTNGQVVMAPIRSGVGLRLGANLGYVRFTPRATWNPF